jgi:hypothetical protein
MCNVAETYHSRMMKMYEEEKRRIDINDKRSLK